MDGPQTHASEHGERRFGDHGHVDQYAVALDHTQILKDGRHALHFGVQVTVGVGFFGVGFGRHKDQRRLVGALGQVAVHRVVAQVGLAANEPFGKRRIAVIANLLGRDFPVHQLGLLGPESVAVVDRALVKFCKIAHKYLLKIHQVEIEEGGDVLAPPSASEFIIMAKGLAIS